MKAIQVKRLADTNTKPERLKAFIKGHQLTMGLHELEELNEDWGETNERLLAVLFMVKLGWSGKDSGVEIIGKGTLPNEDIVFILKNVK